MTRPLPVGVTLRRDLPAADVMPFARRADELAALRADCVDRSELVARMSAGGVRRLALAGTPADVRHHLTALADAGATGAVLVPVGRDAPGAPTSLAHVL